MFVHMQDQVFHHKKQTALQALDGNQLQQALELYTEALQIAQTLPHLFSEIPKILTNRSLVYYRQGKFQLALHEANHSINVNRLWIKVTHIILKAKAYLSKLKVSFLDSLVFPSLLFVYPSVCL